MKLRHPSCPGSLPSLCFAALSAAFAGPAFSQVQEKTQVQAMAPIFQTAVRVTETITDNPALNGMLTRKYRGDWKLEA